MRYAFEPHSNNYEKLEDTTNYFSPATHIGIFDGDILASTLTVIHYSQRIRGIHFPMAGIAGVATKPEYKHRHLVRRLFEKTFGLCHKDPAFFMPISSLYPFKFSYYEKFGYSWVDDLTFITSWLDDVIQCPPTGHVIEEEKNYEQAIVRARGIYRRFSQLFNGLIDRDKTLNAFERRLDKGFFFFCKDLTGTDTGYIVIWFVEEDTMGIREFVSLDMETRQTLWNFVARQEGHRKYFKIIDYHPHSIQTYPYLKEPRVYKSEFRPNSMLRIVDVRRLLEGLTYPPIIDSVEFRILDDMCNWNEGPWQLRIENIKGRLLQISTSTSDVILDIKGLAQLVAGYKTTDELKEQALVKGDAIEISKFDSIFPKNPFILRDFF